MQKLVGGDLEPGKWYIEHWFKENTKYYIYTLSYQDALLLHQNSTKIHECSIVLTLGEVFYTAMSEMEQLLLVPDTQELLAKYREMSNKIDTLEF